MPLSLHWMSYKLHKLNMTVSCNGALSGLALENTTSSSCWIAFDTFKLYIWQTALTTVNEHTRVSKLILVVCPYLLLRANTLFGSICSTFSKYFDASSTLSLLRAKNPLTMPSIICLYNISSIRHTYSYVLKLKSLCVASTVLLDWKLPRLRVYSPFAQKFFLGPTANWRL